MFLPLYRCLIFHTQFTLSAAQLQNTKYSTELDAARLQLKELQSHYESTMDEMNTTQVSAPFVVCICILK